MKLNIYNIGGKVVKDDDRYLVKDNPVGNKLILSSTLLEPNKSTSGHFHDGQEEVYFFMKGSGEMELDSERFKVKEGDIVNIKDEFFIEFSIQIRKSNYILYVFLMAEIQQEKITKQ